jgi:diacylglycerol kinase family enzyme
MARLMLVANPAASQFTGGDHRHIVGMLSREHMIEAVWPNSAADARVIAADAVTAGFDGVVAMGGDGIVHQVAQSLVGTDVFLGVLPAGTTNVFARQIGLPNRATRAARLLAASPALVQLPVVTVEGSSPDARKGIHHAVFAVGAGVDADIVAAAETEPYRKYRFGAVHYARTAISLLWRDLRRRRPDMTVETDDGRNGGAIGVLAQFHPAFTYFGRRPLRFTTEPPDPMTLLVMERLRMRRLPSLLGHVMAGASLDRIRGLEVWDQVHTFTVASPRPFRMEADGELVGPFTRATIRFRPDALWVASAAPGPSA